MRSVRAGVENLSVGWARAGHPTRGECPSQGEKKKVYERLLMEMLLQAMECGCEELHLGRTAVEIKSSFGALPQPSYFHLLIRHRLLRKLVERGSANYNQDSYIYRHPFK